MYTTSIRLIWVGLLTFTLIGCGKRCGQPLQETPTSITEHEWRLIGSSDMKVQSSLTRFNFLIFKFTSSGTMSLGAGMSGLLKKVINNTAQDDKTATPFSYVIDPSFPGYVCMDYNPSSSSVNTSAGLEGNCRAYLGGTNPSKPIFLYRYELSRWGLKLQQVGTNQSYEFRAYTGALAPDDFCQF